MDSGVVVSVNTSPRNGLPKHPQRAVRVLADGLEGDFHRGATRYSSTKRAVVPNDRTVTLVSTDDLDAMNAALGLSLGPGAVSENFLVAGLGPFAAFQVGDRFTFEDGDTRVVLRVTGQNMPCKQLLVYHPQLVRVAANKVDDHLENRRGLLCVVESVEGAGVLAAGARVRAERAAPAGSATASGPRA